MFETRDPARQAWQTWDREHSLTCIDIPEAGPVETWVEVTAVSGDFVSFRHTFVFMTDQTVLTSESTLRFRGREELTGSLLAAGFIVTEVRDAPDRPGLEIVFVAVRDRVDEVTGAGPPRGDRLGDDLDDVLGGGALGDLFSVASRSR